ncbi:MAG: A/G-specific adenine glycosylase [Schleiferiaceae bacterium]|nr:A/G-specific adenine glycosylase [Schleiferiaceae bacterium]
MPKQSFSRALLDWYERHKRPLPWRTSKDPYIIWLSEIILQQTRVEQGLPYFHRFVEKYPTVEDLAQAPLDEVLKQWEGLGYYSRARNMHRAARQVAGADQGFFPDTAQGLAQLPGVGPYTSRAIASMAYGEAVAVLDGNVFRVMSRLEAEEAPINKPQNRALFQELVEQRLDHQRPGTFNQAIMELGALVCTPRKPACAQCPVQEHCKAYAAGNQEKYPVKVRRKAKKDRYLHYLFLRQEDKVALEQRQEGIWQGLYQFPLVEATAALSPRELGAQAEKEGLLSRPEEVSQASSVLPPHALTHQQLHLQVFEVNLAHGEAPGAEGLEWVSVGRLKELAFPRPLRRWLDQKQLILPFPK